MCRAPLGVTRALAIAALVSTSALAQPPALNVEFVGEIQLNEPASPSALFPTSDIYVAGDYAYVGTFMVEEQELYIVDISDPANLELVATVPITGTAHDVKVAGDIAVVSGHPTQTGLGGITVIDVSNPREPQVLSRLTDPCGDGVHNSFLYAGRAYLAHASCPGLTIVDLADPSNPVISGTWRNTMEGFSNIIHDIFILDDVAYISDIPQGFGGLVIADVSDPDRLVTLSALQVPEGTHSAAAENGFVYYNQELNTSSTMRVADVRDLRQPTEVGTVVATEFLSASPLGSHNPWIENGLMYWAHYDSGLRIFDLYDPAHPVEIGYYVDGSTWGVQSGRDGIVLISESTLSGLRAVRFVPPAHAIRGFVLSHTSLVLGRDEVPDLQITAITEPFPSAPPGEIARITVGFPDLESTSPLELTHAEDGRFVGRIQIPDDITVGRYVLRATLEDERGHIYPAISGFTVFPQDDAIIFDDALSPDWEQTSLFSADIDYEASDEIFAGLSAVGLDANGFTIEWSPTEPIAAAAYKSLRFAFHPGDSIPGRRPSFRVYLNESRTTVDLVDPAGLLVDLEKSEWQQVEIPLSDFVRGGDFDVQAVRFFGNLRGSFFLDDIRLVTGAPPVGTAVLEEHQDTQPTRHALGDSYPNPFNAATIIPFNLAAAGHVTVAIYNLAGQQVAQLTRGWRVPGEYHLRWDGTNDSGRVLASGTYLVRLQIGSTTQTRKLMLLQ